MLSCCTVKCYGDAFELICFEFNFGFYYFFILRNNGTVMAVLAAPLPAALGSQGRKEEPIYIVIKIKCVLTLHQHYTEQHAGRIKGSIHAVIVDSTWESAPNYNNNGDFRG